MVIAIDTRFLSSNYLVAHDNFLYECLKKLTIRYCEHEFIFIFDRPYDETLIFSNNIRPVIVSPLALDPMLSRIWYTMKIPGILKKYHAKIFLSQGGSYLFHTNISQCLLLNDLGVYRHPGLIKSRSLLHQKFIPFFIRKANRIITSSEFSKSIIEKKYGFPKNKIDIIYHGVSELFVPITFEKKESIKTAYASGHEYFLFAGMIHPENNLVNLLKAFSEFKKRQKSSMKLLLVGTLLWKKQVFSNLLNSFRFKADVILLEYVDQEELSKITAAAYGVVYPKNFEGFGVQPLDAMKCLVPVLAGYGSTIAEMGKEAILYFDAENHMAIAQKMMELFKDENLRKELIRKGSARVACFTWDKTAELLLNSIIKAQG